MLQDYKTAQIEAQAFQRGWTGVIYTEFKTQVLVCTSEPSEKSALQKCRDYIDRIEMAERAFAQASAIGADEIAALSEVFG